MDICFDSKSLSVFLLCPAFLSSRTVWTYLGVTCWTSATTWTACSRLSLQVPGLCVLFCSSWGLISLFKVIQSQQEAHCLPSWSRSLLCAERQVTFLKRLIIHLLPVVSAFPTSHNPLFPPPAVLLYISQRLAVSLCSSNNAPFHAGTYMPTIIRLSLSSWPNITRNIECWFVAWTPSTFIILPRRT